MQQCGTDPVTRENSAEALRVALDEAANDIMNLPRAGGHVPFVKCVSCLTCPGAQKARLRENVAPFAASKQKHYAKFQNQCIKLEFFAFCR